MCPCLANRLSEAGRPAEALDTIQEAISYFRPLAEQIPSCFGRDLLRALNNQVRFHDELDQPGEA